jgi:hypothetical protein
MLYFLEELEMVTEAVWVIGEKERETETIKTRFHNAVITVYKGICNLWKNMLTYATIFKK